MSNAIFVKFARCSILCWIIWLHIVSVSNAADLDLSIHTGPNKADAPLSIHVSHDGLVNARGGSLLGNDSWQLKASNGQSNLALRINAHILPKRGVYGVAFHIQNKINRYLLPVGMGVAIPAEGAKVVLYSPSQWMASFLLAELNDGSVIAVWAQEGGYPFKKLTLQGNGDFFIEMFRDADQTVDSHWTMRAYPNWQLATDAFRTEVLASKHASSGKRAENLTDVINLQLGNDGNAVKTAIQKLSTQHDPKKTLLYMPLWRARDYDESYPDYTPKPYVKEAITFAHSLGFRIMLHFNMDFVSPNTPERELFWSDRFLRWSALGCKKSITYHLDKHPERDSFRVDRGSLGWQNYFVSLLEKSRKDLGFDGIHLDVSSSIPVGCNNTMMVGTETLLGKIRMQMPDVLIGGEYINENSYTETDIYQALPIEIAGWPEIPKGHFHPLGLRMFAPARAYGHLRGGAVDPDGKIVAEKRAQIAIDFDGKMDGLMIPTVWISPSKMK